MSASRPELEASRLEAVDQERIRRSMGEALELWRSSSMAPAHELRPHELEALKRVGAHAIGCAEWDLRSSELELLEAWALEAAVASGWGVAVETLEAGR